jgi:hypothetical protein
MAWCVAALACGVGFAAGPAAAQATRADAIWARRTTQTITLDGVLGEAAWASAESVTVQYPGVTGFNAGEPGSGWKEEAGVLARDRTFTRIKFLVNGNQLYVAFIVRDSSVGGSADFNRHDGLLMAIKDHRDPFATIHGPVEYFYSWWHPEDLTPLAVGKEPGFRGFWSTNDDLEPRTAEQIQAWDGKTKVRGGVSNSDAVPDSGYTVELRFDVGMMGYTPGAAGGDIIEWNISIYDCDWLWPQAARFSANRTWWQSPWGNAMWYNEVRIHTRPDVTTSSGALPFIGPEVRIPSAGGYAAPTIDGFLTEPVWQTTQHFDIKHVADGDFSLRDTYPGVMKWRAGQFQPTVNGGQALVTDPGDARIKWFFKGDSLYIGFNVNDQVVQFHPILDRWDGFIVTIQDTAHYTDHNQNSRRLGFHVGPGGVGVADDYLPFLRDTAHAAKFGLKLKPGTTVDTLGTTADQGYTAELMVNMRALGFPAGLGSKLLYIGIDMLDGDSFPIITDSYGTRTWWGREYEHECCPAAAYFDPTRFVTAVDDGVEESARSALIGNFPNPVTRLTMVRYTLAAPADVTLEVYDLQGRLVAQREIGMQTAGVQQTPFSPGNLGAGLYLYRVKLTHPTQRTSTGTLNGRMMVLK